MADPILVDWFAAKHAAAIHDMTPDVFAHAVARDAALPPSPLADAVRAADEAELRRRVLVAGGVR